MKKESGGGMYTNGGRTGELDLEELRSVITLLNRNNKDYKLAMRVLPYKLNSIGIHDLIKE